VTIMPEMIITPATLHAALTGTLVAVSVPGTIVLLLVIGTGLAVWAFMVGRRLVDNKKKLQGVQQSLEIDNKVLKGELEKSRQEGREVSSVSGRLKNRNNDLRKTNRTLEKILSVSARINATVYLPDLLPKVVAAVQEINGFGKVVLYVWSRETHAFEARAFAGVEEMEKPAVIAEQISNEQYEELSNVRHRYSNCYLVPVGTENKQGVFQPGQGVPSVQVDRNWRSGTQLIVPLISLKGEVIGYLKLDAPTDGLIPDLVQIKHLEFLVQQAATAIESAGVYDSLARNNAELSRASEKLESLSEMKNQFVANVSHELRTPLTSISAYTEILQQNMDSMNYEARSEFLKVINDQSRKLTEIVDDILNLGNMTNGRTEVNTVETDMVTLIRRMEDSWRSRALEQDIIFKVETESESIKSPVDTILFQQMLGHLLNNAFKFTQPGGRITVRVVETGTAVRLQVQDTGIGIPEDKLVEIFDRFYQVDGSATREHNGQGVGLAICRDIVAHHDGRIWADNVESGGTIFTVLLPRRAVVVQAADGNSLPGMPFEPGEFMQRLMHWISESMGVQTATLMMPDAEEDYLTIRAGIGISDSVVQSARVRHGSGFAGKVWAEKRTLLIEDMTGDPLSEQDFSEPRYTTPSLLCVPLAEGDKFVGVISVNNKIDGRPLGPDDSLFLESLASRLTGLLLRYRSWQDGVREFQTVREALRATTAVGHLRHGSLRQVCQEICLETARDIMLPTDEMEHLAFSLQFYDVGLGTVPPQLLKKPGPFEPHEQILMQKHVSASLNILEPLNPHSKVRQLILHHHENFDGTGYPLGLAGESIPLGSRLVRLTDTLAALLSERPWRPAFTLDQALAEIRAGAGKAYCPRMAGVFLAEAERRRDRITALQKSSADSRELIRPSVATETSMILKP
jgi:signal transduction histidine kinase